MIYNKKEYDAGGFTLIELLVVIAIIGLLSSVVLASLNSARSKGSDATIKSNLANSRAQAALFYDANSNSYYGGTAATDVCNSAGVVNNVKSIYLNVEAARVAGGFGQAINVVSGTAGAWNVATCHSTANAWAAEAPLKSSTSGAPIMWCVDSTGAAEQNNAALGANIVAC